MTTDTVGNEKWLFMKYAKCVVLQITTLLIISSSPPTGCYSFTISQAMEPPKPQPVEPIQQPSLPSRNEFIQNGFSDFSGSTGTTSQAASGASKVSAGWLMASPERPPLSMSDLNVEYITPACPIWMSHNRCFHVLRSITDLSGRSSSRAVPLIGLCRCQRNWRRLWCRLTSRIGPQCLWQKHRLN